ncbi:MAG: glycosyl transferase family 1 [Candidatus Methylomirabilales bacterium]
MGSDPLARLQPALRESYQTVQRLAGLAEDFAGRGRMLEAVACTQIAAHQAYVRHAGMFASPRLERLLLRVGRAAVAPAVGPPPAPRAAGGARPGRVLHVISHARPIGGDTRFAWRWIQADGGRRHSVAITRQRDLPMPASLADAVAGSGGTLSVLDRLTADPIARARALRRLSRRADLVVCHLFPDDVVPLLAFAHRDGTPPVVLVNHADHAFWLGAGVGDVVAHPREAGAVLAERRRGIARARGALLPIPLPDAERACPAEEAKRRLGYARDEVVLLSIATAFKYRAIAGPSFLEAVLPVLLAEPRAVLLVVGPQPEGAWAEAARATGGRLRALGRRADTGQFYDAADVYLDSFPFTSITSCLEAGSRGIPVAAFSPHPEAAPILGPGAPGLRHVLQAETLDAYRRLLGGLIGNAARRRAVGEATRDAIREAHGAAGWAGGLESVYRAAAAAGRAPEPAGSDGMDASPLDLLVHGLYARQAVGLAETIEGFIRPLPYSARLRALPRMLALDRAFSFGMFLPRGLERLVERRLKGWRALPGVAALLRSGRSAPAAAR